MKGVLCISLDFEKYWGIHDLENAELLSRNFDRVKEVVNNTLILFEKYNIRATWASVGLLNHNNVQDLKDCISSLELKYSNSQLNPQNKLSKLDELDSEILLGQNELKSISNTSGQEVASHTLSHFYCLEDGVDADQFEKDLTIFNQKFDSKISSIIFPRNQVNEDFLNVCKKHSYKVYRGSQKSWFWKTSPYKKEGIFKRGFRLSEAYFPIYPVSTTKQSDLRTQAGLINVPANRFLRPVSGSEFREKLKISRIKSGMTKAAKRGEVFHIWWHPHNFVNDQNRSLRQLEELLSYFDGLRNSYGMISKNMGDFAGEK